VTGDTTAPRDWVLVRQAAIDAVTAVTGDPQAAPGIADAVLTVCDEEAVNRMAARLLDDTRIRSMDFRNGMHMELQPARELAALWVGAARGMLGDAPNYVEMETHLAGDPQRYVFRVERCGHLTPHQARIQAEERAADAERQASELRAEVERLSRIIAGQHEDATAGNTRGGSAARQDPGQ